MGSWVDSIPMANWEYLEIALTLILFLETNTQVTRMKQQILEPLLEDVLRSKNKNQFRIAARQTGKEIPVLTLYL